MRALRHGIPATSVIALALAVNGFVNLATGLAPVFRVARYVEEIPDYLRITPFQRTSGLISVLLGLLLLLIGRGLYDRKRRSWFAAVIVLFVLMANNLWRGTTPHTAAFSSVLIVALLAWRRRFDVPSRRRLGYAQVVAVLSVTFALLYGIVGTYLMKSEFDGIVGWTDAVYFTFVTYSTLGYGDILPVTENAKVFATTMVPIGLVAFITALTALIGPAVEDRMRGVLTVMQKLQYVADHVVICGYSNVSETIIEALQSTGTPYVVIDHRDDFVRQLAGKSHDVVRGCASRAEVLEQARLGQAGAVICAFDEDSMNILVALTARRLRGENEDYRYRILVRVEDAENIDKAKEVGADDVISPSTTAGRMMAQKAVEGDRNGSQGQ